MLNFLAPMQKSGRGLYYLTPTKKIPGRPSIRGGQFPLYPGRDKICGGTESAAYLRRYIVVQLISLPKPICIVAHLYQIYIHIKQMF